MAAPAVGTATGNACRLSKKDEQAADRAAKKRREYEKMNKPLSLRDSVRGVFADGQDMGYYTTDYGTKALEVYGKGSLAEVAGGLDRLMAELEAKHGGVTWRFEHPAVGDDGVGGGNGEASP